MRLREQARQNGVEFVFGSDSVCDACGDNPIGESFKPDGGMPCEPGSAELVAWDERALEQIMTRLSGDELVDEAGLTPAGVEVLFERRGSRR